MQHEKDGCGNSGIFCVFAAIFRFAPIWGSAAEKVGFEHLAEKNQ